MEVHAFFLFCVLCFLFLFSLFPDAEWARVALAQRTVACRPLCVPRGAPTAKMRKCENAKKEPFFGQAANGDMTKKDAHIQY